MSRTALTSLAAAALALPSVSAWAPAPLESKPRAKARVQSALVAAGLAPLGAVLPGG